jgi:hypothetical protein
MTTQDKVKVIAEYDGWVNTGLLHPFKPVLGYQYRKEGLIGVSWLSKMPYLTSLDWLHGTAMKVIDEVKNYSYSLSEHITESRLKHNYIHTELFPTLIDSCCKEPINGEYVDLFNAVYDGIVFLNSNK